MEDLYLEMKGEFSVHANNEENERNSLLCIVYGNILHQMIVIKYNWLMEINISLQQRKKEGVY